MKANPIYSAIGLCAVVAAGFAPKLPLHEASFDLDPDKTHVEYTVGDVLHTVHGSFKLKSGAIHFDPITGNAGGRVVVDATSGESGSEGRDQRMHKNILQSVDYPEITFAPDRIEGYPAGPLRVHGIFSLHGKDHEITVPTDVQLDGAQVTATAHFVVPYVQWGLKNPSTFVLRVSDKVRIDLRMTGRLHE